MISTLLLFVFGSIFGAWSWLGPYWPVLIILLGLIFLIRAIFRPRARMIQGLIFDFDGLILNTEASIYQSWQELYRSCGRELSFERFAQTIGTADNEPDLVAELEALVGKPLDQPRLAAWQHPRERTHPGTAPPPRRERIPGRRQRAGLEGRPGFQLGLLLGDRAPHAWDLSSILTRSWLATTSSIPSPTLRLSSSAEGA